MTDQSTPGAIGSNDQLERIFGVTMKKFFSHSNDGGFLLHDTAAAAEAEAQASIDYYRDGSSEGWPEEVEFVCWGEVKRRAKQTEILGRPDECDYALFAL